MLNAGHASPAAYPAATMRDNIDAAHSTNLTDLYQQVLPDSQESYVSSASSTFAAPKYLSWSSNISNSPTADTELTSPTSNGPSSQIKGQNQYRTFEPTIAPSPPQTSDQNVQDAAPRIDTSITQRAGDTAASPMSLDSPVLAQGSKRTASGKIKGSDAPAETSIAPTNSHKRTKSTESVSNTRIGELSAQLRTRLSYAMIKVQNGWEKQSLEELEDLPSQRSSPMSALGRSERPFLDSPRERIRRHSGVSEHSDQLMLSPTQNSPPNISRPVGATSSSFWRSIPKTRIDASTPYITTTTTGENGSVLAPAAEIGPVKKRRSSASQAPPPLLGSAQRKHYSDLGVMGTPRTPTASTPRAGILRMPSQQAEKDAVDTLLFMSSPNNSERLAHTSADTQIQQTQLRQAGHGVRRVMFEQPIKEQFRKNQQQPKTPVTSQQTVCHPANPGHE